MRITLVHYSFLPVIGGVEIVVAEHARLFADHGHQVTLLGRRGASQDPRIRFRELPGGADPGQEDALREALWDQDVVIVHNVLTMPFEPAWTAFLWRLADELAGVRFVAWVHDLAVGKVLRRCAQLSEAGRWHGLLDEYCTELRGAREGAGAKE